jgi:hypothetical protein
MPLTDVPKVMTLDAPPDDAPLRGVEAITAGALRRALAVGEP